MADHTEVLSRVELAIANGDIEAACKALEEGAKQTGDAALVQEHAFLLWRCFEFDRSTELFDGLCKNPATTVTTLQQIAGNYFRLGRFKESANVMKTAVDRSEAANRTACLEQWAACLERSNQLDDAVEVANRALAEDPDSSQAVRLLAHIDKRNGRYEDAISRLTNRLKRGGDWHWGLRYELAAALDRTGEYDRAWQELVLAKQELNERTRPHLEHSYAIRKRQGDLIRKVTDTDLKNWHRTKIDSPRRIAIMAGFPRSGTTLLEQILAANPDCIGTDETGILSVQFTTPIVREAETAFDALLEIRALNDAQLSAGRQCYWKFTEASIGESTGNRLLIEKDPLLTCDLLLPLRLFPDARVIMPLRDPRDVAISFFFTMVPLIWNSAPSTSIVETARFYHDCMRHWLLLRERLPWPTIETKYEDVVDDSFATVKRLTEFLELEWTPAMLDPDKRSEQKAISTPTYDDVTKPVYKRAVSRWRNYEKQIEPALKTLEPYVKEFGYE